MRMEDIKVGMRFRFISGNRGLLLAFWGKTGVIEYVSEWGFEVMLDEPVETRRGPWASVEPNHIELLDETPEELAQRLERQRKEEEQQLDQQRRHDHAMKYL